MRVSGKLSCLPCLLLLAGCPAVASAQGAPSASAPSQPPAPDLPRVEEHVEVVATRIPEPPDEVPAAIEVFTGDELRSLGARDLGGALALAAGVDIAPGGDAGPASAVPGFWGLKEFDAFLLVVDGMPWGGAFNPALATLSLDDVSRIEVLRGPAPVTYGATSFVGVINVVHKGAGAAGRTAAVRLGSYGSGSGLFASSLPFPRGWESRLSVDGERQGFADSRTAYRRVHALWRNSTAWGRGHFFFNVDGTLLNQDPASPSPRVGPNLSPLVPIDANQNPAAAFLNDHRAAFSAGFDRPVGTATWTTTGSFSRARQDILRGYLQAVEDGPLNAVGIRERIGLTDIYVDSHVAWAAPGRVRVVAGGDFLHGEGVGQGADFEYQAPLDGSYAPSAVVPPTLDVRIEDRREFAGAYLMGEWRPTARLRVDAGARLNATAETREAGSAADQAASADQGNTRTRSRLSGSAGAIYTAWSRGPDRLSIFVNYRNTFKPAAFDFGIGEGEGEGLLEPETSASYEAGIKSRLFRGRLGVEASAFLMNFDNLVIATLVNGLPALANAGTQRFKGIETAASLYLPMHLAGRLTYSYHDARFRDYVAEFDGVPTQLGGRFIEMSPRHLASVGLVLAPEHGLVADLQASYTGSRYLDKRNAAPAQAFVTFGAGVGYRFGRWEARVDGRNLTDERAPVSESELGDAQYYRQPARRIDAGLTMRF